MHKQRQGCKQEICALVLVSIDSSFVPSYFTYGILAGGAAAIFEYAIHEDHISADIPLAHRKYFLATGDMQFLRDDWPLLNASCRFWACRFGRVDSVGKWHRLAGYYSCILE